MTKQQSTEKPERRPDMQLINRSRYSVALTGKSLNPKDPGAGVTAQVLLDPTATKDVTAEEWDHLKEHPGTIKLLDRRWVIAIPRVAARPAKKEHTLRHMSVNDAIEQAQIETEIEILQLYLENEREAEGDEARDREPVVAVIHQQLSRLAIGLFDRK